MLHPALRYVVLRRWRNRVLSTLRGLRTPMGLLGLLIGLGVVASIVFGARFGEDLAPGPRAALVVGTLGFMTIMGVLSGIGQRGLVFVPADLDFLFPAPIARRQLLLYHFVPHYLMAVFLGLLYLLALGGRFLPHPGTFFVGVVLCQVTNAHLSAFTAELSMVVADRLYRRLRVVTTVLVIGATLGGMLLLIGGITRMDAVGERVSTLATAPLLEWIFFPAVKALELGLAPDAATRGGALLALLACAGGSLALVLLLRVDFVESSFVATRSAWRKVEQMRRGVHRASVRRSAPGPRTALFRGAGAVLWLGLLTMRRQLRAALGGILVVLVMLAVFSAQRGGRTVAQAILVMLAMVPLWMPLPVGFRLPREQLLALRRLPLAPAPLAGALLAVPVLVVLLLQTLAVVVLIVLGALEPVFGLAVLPAYAALGATMTAVESWFVLKRPHPNSIHLAHSVAQVFLQFLAVLPGLLAFGLLERLGGPRTPALLAATVLQAAVARLLVGRLGRRLQTGEIVTA